MFNWGCCRKKKKEERRKGEWRIFNWVGIAGGVEWSSKLEECNRNFTVEFMKTRNEGKVWEVGSEDSKRIFEFFSAVVCAESGGV